jgi:tetratricopeptide (TPR) repeat protein
MIVGAGAGVAAITGAAWVALGRYRLPAEARQLLDEAEGALVEGSVEQTSNAVAKLRRAVQLAPESGDAWGLLGLAYEKQARLAQQGARQDLASRGIAAAKRSLAIDPNQPDARAAFILAMSEYRNWLAYERASRAALQDHPDHLELQLALADVLAQVGRFGEGLDILDQAAKRYPRSPLLAVHRIESLTTLGRLDEAESAIERAYGLWPRNYSVWFRRLYYFHSNGRPAEAIAMVEDKANRPVGIPGWKYDLCALQVRSVASGDRAKIREALNAWEKAAPLGIGFTENTAIFAASVGDFDRAFRMLEALYFNRGFSIAEERWAAEQAMFSGRERETSILFFPQLAGLRRDPRFATVTRELGLDDYWKRSATRPDV